MLSTGVAPHKDTTVEEGVDGAHSAAADLIPVVTHLARLITYQSMRFIKPTYPQNRRLNILVNNNLTTLWGVDFLQLIDEYILGYKIQTLPRRCSRARRPHLRRRIPRTPDHVCGSYTANMLLPAVHQNGYLVLVSRCLRSSRRHTPRMHDHITELGSRRNPWN